MNEGESWFREGCRPIYSLFSGIRLQISLSEKVPNIILQSKMLGHAVFKMLDYPVLINDMSAFSHISGILGITYEICGIRESETFSLHGAGLLIKLLTTCSYAVSKLPDRVQLYCYLSPSNKQQAYTGY